MTCPLQNRLSLICFFCIKLYEDHNWFQLRLLIEVVAQTDFDFASYYADNMVLQKAPVRAVLWGYANQSDIGSVVTVDIDGANQVTGEVFQGVEKSKPLLAVKIYMCISSYF